MDLAVGLIGGFLLGILASGIAWLITEHAAAPLLDIVVDQNRAQGQSPGNPAHEFYHVRVRNVPPSWPLPGRRPAWACVAAIDVVRQDGSRAITGSVIARWTSQPAPLLPVVSQGQVGNVLDPARLMQARRIDVHRHSEEPIPVVVKFEGEQDCYIFTNESYVFPRWQNPSWRIPPGHYRLRVTVYYERGRTVKDFELRNEGPSRDDVHLDPLGGATGMVNQPDSNLEYYHALYHLVTHWTACVALEVYLLTIGLAAALQQQLPSKWPYCVGIAVPGAMVFYIITRVWQFGNIVNEKLPPTYLQRHGKLHPYNLIIWYFVNVVIVVGAAVVVWSK